MSLNIELLRSSFAAVAPRANELSDIFYAKLFADNPGVMPLFAHVELDEQKKKLLAAIALVVANLENPEILQETLEALGKRHIEYGAEPGHYPPVGAALLYALEQVAGDAWTPELEEAWAQAYGAISDMMLGGAQAA